MPLKSGQLRKGLRNVSTGVYAIPDSGMFQNPIYQFYAGDYSGSDGDSGFGYPEVLAGLSDAAPVGNPIYRAEQAGWAAGEYDGTDDGHNVSTDSQMPSGADPVSIAALVYIKSTGSSHAIYEYGGPNDGERFLLYLNDSNQLQLDIRGTGTPTILNGTTVSTGSWVTVGGTVEADTATSYLNGSEDASDTEGTVNLVDDSHGLAYRRVDGGNHLDGFIAEVIISAANETEQAFTDYHNDRLG